MHLFRELPKYGLEVLHCFRGVNALWFWATLPETAKTPLEEMKSLPCQKIPWFVPDKAKISLQQLWGDEWKGNARELGKVEEKELKIEKADD